MSNPLFDRYKIPFLFSIAITLAVIIFSNQVSTLSQTELALSASIAFVGSIAGFLLVDLEYLIHAYLVDPSSDVSIKIKDLFSHGKFVALIDYYNHEEHTFGELSIRSAMFQIILAGLSLIVVTGDTWIFAKTMVLSMGATLLYFQFAEYLRAHTLLRWFWIFTGNLTDSFYKAYMVVLFIIYIYQFTLL